MPFVCSRDDERIYIYWFFLVGFSKQKSYYLHSKAVGCKTREISSCFLMVFQCYFLEISRVKQPDLSFFLSIIVQIRSRLDTDSKTS